MGTQPERRTITHQEMARRLDIAKAKESLTNAMSTHSLTAMEWISVLNEMTTRMISHGLREEWEELV